VARNLKELVDSGYGIFGLGNKVDNTTIVLILKRENISHRSINEQPFIPNTFYRRPTEIWRMLSRFNATGRVPSSIELDEYRDEIYAHYPGLKCHFVKETVYPRECLITYSGYFATTFHTFLTSYKESGILDMFYKFWISADRTVVRLRVEKRRYAEKKAEVPFELKDPKIISIFIAWGILFVGAALIFIAELLLGLLYKLVVLFFAITSLRN
jgi:hypothetical protein